MGNLLDMAVTNVLTLEAERERISLELAQTLNAVVDAISERPVNVSALGRKLGLNRVTISKLLSGINSSSADELLAVIPGPESLRAAVSASEDHGVDVSLSSAAYEAIDAFATMIRDQYGTRAALNAALGKDSPRLSERVATNSRADVFNGMRRIIGVEAQVWVNAMFFLPSKADDTVIETTTLHGALGIRRLRPDTPFYFVFGSPFVEPGRDGRNLTASPLKLHDFYTNAPAKLESAMLGYQLCHRLVHDQLGKDAVVDTLVVSHDTMGSKRYADEKSALRGMSLVMDLPARALVFDVIVHESLFPGSDAELYVYKPGARGPSNPNDPSSQRDRIPITESVEQAPHGLAAFDVPEVPRYAEMIGRICNTAGYDLNRFRTYRLAMPYPLTGFQYTMAFRAPMPPGGS
ncbi:MAG: hypothetical protein KDA31_03005 [Phycisphaerales bacterium]|nr:hypothetical protein [Phycisphaerales bacterium]MCB9836539.1 hypothetical protein [Phycisphaera sp.]